MNARQQFFSHFEPNGGDFTYRFNPDARGVLVTAEEREQMASVYSFRRYTAIVLSILNLPVTFFVARSVYETPVISSWTATVAWVMLLGVTTSVFAWAYAGPRRIVRGRPYIDFGVSPFVIEQRRLKRLRELHWEKLFRHWFWVGFFGFIAFLNTKDEDFGRVEAASVMFFAFLSFARDAFDKYQSHRQFAAEKMED